MRKSIALSTRLIRDTPTRGFFREAALATIIAVLACATLSAATYGDVEVAIDSQASVQATHGYAEMWVRITNRSGNQAREVRLTLPQRSYSSSGDYLRAVSRTITVAPGQSARVALSYPNRLQIEGNGLGVTIDGNEQKDEVPVHASPNRYSGYLSNTQQTVLFSRSIDTRFPDWAEATRIVLVRGGARAEDPDPAFREPGRSSPGETKVANFVRADLPVANWSTNWLGYSGYDGVVLTDGDLRSMPDEIRSAIGQYVECGGSLLVLGRDAQLPGNWKPVKWPSQLGAECDAGFGTCILVDRTDLSERPWLYLHSVVPSWNKVLRPWLDTRSAAEANAAFPIVDDIGVPVNGLLALMFIFAIVAGPVTLYVLARRGNKLWLFWVVPLISALTCLAVFGYMALSEGWSGRARIVGITLLDENTRRSSSLGWSAYYTPLSAGGGLHFSPNTEVSFQNGDDVGYHSYRRRSSSAAALSIDWTHEQHLASGWMSPRVPAHFIVRKSEIRRERITFARGPDGRPEAVNGLGVNLVDLWYADDAGNVFHVQNVAAGEKISLNSLEKRVSSTGQKSLRDIYASDWSKIVNFVATDASAVLKPRTYLAVMESAPFFDEGLQNVKSRRDQSVVIGIIREGGDEN